MSTKNLSKKLIMFIAAVLAAFLLFSLTRLMAVNGIRTGSYTNPVVASTVVEGTVFDRNGKILSVSSNGERSYPNATYGLPFIQEAEKLFSFVINPHPGYDEATTYGKNIYLTIDADIQYLLEKAVNTLKTYQYFEKAYGFVLDASTGDVLALLDSSLLSKVKGLRTRTVLRTTDINGKQASNPVTETFSMDNPEFLKIYSESNVKDIEGKYLVYIGTTSGITRGIDQAVLSFKAGLKSQSKI